MLKNITLKRSTFVALLFIFAFMGIVYAATPIYGPYSYSKDIKYQFYGDLSPSGLGSNQTRGAYALWHDVQFRDIFYNTIDPGAGSYYPTVQFDLIENPGDPDIGKKRGYHVAPNTKESVTMLAKKMQGNPDYVWRVLSGKGKSVDYPNGHPLVPPNSFYMVENIDDWVSFGKIAALSGGGVADKDMNYQEFGWGTRGVDYPVYKTQYQVTPWPEIYKAEPYENGKPAPASGVTLANGQLQIDARTFGFYQNRFIAWVVKGKVTKEEVLADMADGRRDEILNNKEKAALVKDMPVSQIAHWDAPLPVSSFGNLLLQDGTENEMTLVISDGKDRIQVKPFKVKIKPSTDLEVVCPEVSISPAPPQPPHTKAVVSIPVVNHSDKETYDTYLLWRWGRDKTANRVDIPALKPREKRIIQVQTEYPSEIDYFITNLNPDRKAPSYEENWENNICKRVFDVQRINLKAKAIRLNVPNPQVGEKIKFDVLVENESKYEDVKNTDLGYRINGGEMRIISGINISAGEEKWISGLEYQSKSGDTQLSVWAKINQAQDKPANEWNGTANPYLDNVVTANFPLGNLDYYMDSVSNATVPLGESVNVKMVYGRYALPIDNGGSISPVKIRLALYDNKKNEIPITTKTVTLNKGDKKEDYVVISTNGLKPGSYTIMASINIPPEVGETTYANNIAIGTLQVLGIPTALSCGYSGSSDSELSYIVCRKNSSGHRKCYYYYEDLNSDIRNLSVVYVNPDIDDSQSGDVPLISQNTTVIKKGQGFTFTVDARYSEDYHDNKSVFMNSAKAVAEFPRADGTIEKVDLVRLEEDSEAGRIKFGLPLNWLHKHSWDESVVNENGNPGSTNPEDENFYYAGGRAHYISLNHPEGSYTFTVKIYSNGVGLGDNELMNCLEGHLIVKGNVMNDFYVRQVNPEFPFPSTHFPNGPTSWWQPFVNEVFDQDMINWYNYKDQWRNWPN
ncbi:hypothetical protein [Aneurinibacillus thermoaerophilus]|uniref:hypothetical protein n=1 Tax=Aneurinibacillus thermoaerophilus TaxID=143495 RepID=UPI002E223F22|nr:hypothetical protein [Aneurinibacillus thermoaerophilus]